MRVDQDKKCAISALMASQFVSQLLCNCVRKVFKAVCIKLSSCLAE